MARHPGLEAIAVVDERSAAFFALGLAVSSGVMIYPIVRSMFSVRIVGTALTSLNFFVLLAPDSPES